MIESIQNYDDVQSVTETRGGVRVTIDGSVPDALLSDVVESDWEMSPVAPDEFELVRDTTLSFTEAEIMEIVDTHRSLEDASLSEIRGIAENMVDLGYADDTQEAMSEIMDYSSLLGLLIEELGIAEPLVPNGLPQMLPGDEVYLESRTEPLIVHEISDESVVLDGVNGGQYDMTSDRLYYLKDGERHSFGSYEIDEIR